MKSQFTAAVESAPEGGLWAICLGALGAIGQGDAIEEAEDSLRQAIELILEDRRVDIPCSSPEEFGRGIGALPPTPFPHPNT
jgi:predicted RNase H-like HicB family nuclease